MSFKAQGSYVARAAATGAAFYALNQTVVDSKGDGVKRAAVSAASDFVASNAVDIATPMMAGSSNEMGKFATSIYLQPLASGLAYAAAGAFVSADDRPFLMKVLHQAGASAIGGYLESPLSKFIGV